MVFSYHEHSLIAYKATLLLLFHNLLILACRKSSLDFLTQWPVPCSHKSMKEVDIVGPLKGFSGFYFVRCHLLLAFSNTINSLLEGQNCCTAGGTSNFVITVYCKPQFTVTWSYPCCTNRISCTRQKQCKIKGWTIKSKFDRNVPTQSTSTKQRTWYKYYVKTYLSMSSLFSELYPCYFSTYL